MCKKRLQPFPFGLYASPVTHTVIGFSSLNKLADSRLHSDMRFFCVRKPTHTRIMAGRNGGAFALAGFPICQSANPVTSRHPFSSVVARLLNVKLGAFHMAVFARPYFIRRFMQCHGNKPVIHTVTAASEREARAHIPAQRLISVSRISQGATHD